MFRNKKILLFLVLFLECLSLFAQSDSTAKVKSKKVFNDYFIGEYRFRSRNNWVLFGFGPNILPVLSNFTNANMEIDINFYDKSDRLWQIGYNASSLDYLAFGGATLYLHSLNLGRGKTIEKQYYKLAGFAGPAIVYSNYFPFDSVKTFNNTREIGVGLQLQLQVILKPVYDFGVAISPFININTIQTVAGISFCVYASNAMDKKIRY